MKNQTLKSIFSFYFLASIFCIHSNGQIVYTDVNPDITKNCSHSGIYSCSSADSIDINNDGILDFKISCTLSIKKHFGCSGNGCLLLEKRVNTEVSPLSHNAVLSDSSGYPLYMHVNDIVKGGNMDTVANQIIRIVFGYTSINYNGNWSSSTDGYLGIKLNSASQSYYGWIRLSVSASVQSLSTASVTYIIKDFAYNSIPNQPILAGETSCATPTVNLTQSGSVSFCAGDSVTLTANGTGYQYQWKKNNVNITGAAAKTYVAKTAGVYKCKVTNSCGSITSGTRTVTVPCRESNESFVETLEHLSVYPNPAINFVTIKFPSDEAGEIQIVNLFGQIIFSEKVFTDESKIDVSKFPAGMYVMRWNSGENFETKTFSIIKQQ